MRRVALLLVATMVLGTGVVTAAPAMAAKDKKEKKVKSCQKDKNLNDNIQEAFVPFFLGQRTPPYPTGPRSVSGTPT